MTLGQLLCVGNGVRVWKRNANPFQMRPPPGWRSAPGKVKTRKPVARKKKRTWLTAVWLWAVIVSFGCTAFRCGYGVLENRHEQELRIASRRTREAEERLRQWEIRHRVVLQEKQMLQARLVAQQAMLAKLQAELERTQPVLLAGRR